MRSNSHYRSFICRHTTTPLPQRRTPSCPLCGCGVFFVCNEVFLHDVDRIAYAAPYRGSDHPRSVPGILTTCSPSAEIEIVNWSGRG